MSLIRQNKTDMGSIISKEMCIRDRMIEDILQNCRPQTKLCIAANITCEGEYIPVSYTHLDVYKRQL